VVLSDGSGSDYEIIRDFIIIARAPTCPTSPPLELCLSFPNGIDREVRHMISKPMQIRKDLRNQNGGMLRYPRHPWSSGNSNNSGSDDTHTNVHNHEQVFKKYYGIEV
jgi:hypothetical protein